jgi:hypothetical protein
MKPLQLIPAPRLYVPAEVAANLSDKLHSRFLRQTAAQVRRDADQLLRAPLLRERDVTAGYQAVTRPINCRLQCLTAAWVLTRAARYRRAALRHLAGLREWNQISCEANAATSPDDILPFCLSYGEFSATVGLMYDLFRPAMTAAERRVFDAVLDKFLLKAALRCLDNAPWWANKSWSNWNGVCAGGMGLLALAVYDDRPAARQLIPFVEKSLGEYFQSYVKNGGGCHEGTGYWNYGMNYALRYVLSWENATGRKHPALRIKELGRSLSFPVDFTGISFGDNDGWHPAAFFFLAARRLNQHHAALRAAACLTVPKDTPGKYREPRANTGDLLYAAAAIPTDAEMTRLRAAHRKQKVPVARVYRGMDWAALADDEAFPALRLAVRGGSAKVEGHGMLDLLSFRCRVNGELMITDQQDGGYMATTFTRRGSELYGRSAHSKSTLFVDGLSCHSEAVCDKTEVVKGKDILGIRLDASHIILPRWKNLFIGRLVLLVENRYWLVVDHVRSSNPVDTHWLESRFHTLAAARCKQNTVSLRSGREQLQLTFAALGSALMQESRGMPSQPRPQTTIFRWLGQARVADNLHVVALNPGRQKLGVAVRQERGGYVIEITGRGRRRRIRLNRRLQLR